MQLFGSIGLRSKVGSNDHSTLQSFLVENQRLADVERAAGYGRWWYDHASGSMALSAEAARVLQADSGVHGTLDAALVAVAQDDLPGVVVALTRASEAGWTREFRVLSAQEGVRWVALEDLPTTHSAPGMRSGIVRDISVLKMAAMRERLGFAMTQYLVGAQTPQETRLHVIALICEHLGWDWGGYWQAQDSDGNAELVCQTFWQGDGRENLQAFSRESTAMRWRAGQGLVGTVWSTGNAAWVEDVGNNLQYAQRTEQRACGLRSGYAFPVSYVDAEGKRHTHGVLEFYSVLSRQTDAQLPQLSQSIGALLAQMSLRLEHQAQVLRLAQIDDLTGLLNRSHFHACLTQACEAATRNGDLLGLAYIDLDRFKPINDAFGHEAGNGVLREFARRLKCAVPEGVQVARLGGDEFALLLPAEVMPEAAAVLQRILRAASEPFEFEGHELTVSASVGLASFPEDGNTVATLLQSADAAMYRVKNSGRNGVYIAAKAGAAAVVQQQTAMAHRLALETDLHHAIEAHELFLVYQPIVAAGSARMHALEALVRWRRRDGTSVAPDTFIPIAEQSNLIVKLGRWVMESACRDLARLHAAGNASLRMHINLAASEFMSEQLPMTLQSLATQWQLPADCLCLELTETMLMQRPDQVIPVMRSLRRAGFGISLDDFGKGHSSLALLRTLPISSLKVDRAFVRHLEERPKDLAIVQTIIDLGHHLGLEVIAEGIETQRQRELLQQAGCLNMQGYLFDRPLALETLLERPV